MKELMLMAATMMPEEKILEDLQESIVEYQVEKSEESKHKLNMYLHLAIMRFMTDGKPGKLQKIMEEMKKFDREREIFKPNEN